jgi:hypothetical protein
MEIEAKLFNEVHFDDLIQMFALKKQEDGTAACDSWKFVQFCQLNKEKINF